MEDITTYYTWNGLVKLLVGLIVLFGIIKLIIRLIENSAKKNLAKKKFIFWLRNSLFFYVPVAVIIFILGFISINYVTHTILVIISGVFAFPYIRNYLSGIIFKSNPIVNKGALITSTNLEGEIKRLLVLGMIVNTEQGEQYLNYSRIDEYGFTIKSNKGSVLRQTLYLNSELSKDEILDLLFDNPILNFEEKPNLRTGSEQGNLILKYTLESGATTEDLISFLSDNNIESKITRKAN